MGDTVMVNETKVTSTDVKYGNGAIYVIATAVLP